MRGWLPVNIIVDIAAEFSSTEQGLQADYFESQPNNEPPEPGSQRSVREEELLYREAKSPDWKKAMM